MIDQVSSSDGWNLILSLLLLVCYHSSIYGADTGNYTKHCYHFTEIIIQMSTPLVPEYHIRVKISRDCLARLFVTEVLIKNQRQSSVKQLDWADKSFCKEIKNNGKERQ